MSLSYLGLLDTVLLSSVGSIITPCNLCEVLPTVTVQCDPPSKPSPTNTDIVEGIGPHLRCRFRTRSVHQSVAPSAQEGTERRLWYRRIFR
jgi:hypothetical protein